MSAYCLLLNVMNVAPLSNSHCKVGFLVAFFTYTFPNYFVNII